MTCHVCKRHVLKAEAFMNGKLAFCSMKCVEKHFTRARAVSTVP